MTKNLFDPQFLCDTECTHFLGFVRKSSIFFSKAFILECPTSEPKVKFYLKAAEALNRIERNKKGKGIDFCVLFLNRKK